jgi:hypothetical protein
MAQRVLESATEFGVLDSNWETEDAIGSIYYMEHVTKEFCFLVAVYGRSHDSFLIVAQSPN